MRIVVVGAGGVGGYLGAQLWNAGNEVVFVARGQHLSAMRERGLHLESPDRNINVRSFFTDTLDGQHPFELAIVTVKSFDTLAAAKLLRPTIDEMSIVISFQNGIENEAILADVLGLQRVVGGVSYIFSTIKEPGTVRHDGGTTKFKFGEMDGRTSDRCRLVHDVFQHAGIQGDLVENIQKVLWEKWIFICGLGGLTAYARKPIGEILADHKLCELLQTVVHEAATIGRVRGIDAFTNLEEKVMAHFNRLPPNSTSSMYYDLTRGKRVEVEALNGAAVRLGKQLGLRVPANQAVYDVLRPYA